MTTEAQQAEYRRRAEEALAAFKATPLGMFSGQIWGWADFDYATKTYINVDTANVRGAQLYAEFATFEERDAYMAARPKSLGLKPNRMAGPASRPLISFQVSFHANKVTGDANETGKRRLRRFLELCEVYAPAVDKAFVVAACTLAEAKAFAGCK